VKKTLEPVPKSIIFSKMYIYACQHWCKDSPNIDSCTTKSKMLKLFV